MGKRQIDLVGSLVNMGIWMMVANGLGVFLVLTSAWFLALTLPTQVGLVVLFLQRAARLSDAIVAET